MLPKKTMLIMVLSVCLAGGMEQPRLPGEIIRTIARLSLQSHNWTDLEKFFLIQTMDRVNTQWRTAVSLLSDDHFPYQ